jgi:hypothetical protein
MTTYAIGCVREFDGVEHAVVHHQLHRDVAVCGAGKITLGVLGEFDPGEPSACPQCALMVVERTGELAPAIGRLREEFPDVPADAIVSLLADSYRVIVGRSERPLVGKAEDLTRLRLEVRTRHPAGHATGTGPAMTA